MDGFFFGGQPTPEQMAEMEERRQTQVGRVHEVVQSMHDLIDRLGERDLQTLQAMLSNAADDQTSAAFLTGLIQSRLIHSFDKCPVQGCTENHLTVDDIIKENPSG